MSWRSCVNIMPKKSGTKKITVIFFSGIVAAVIFFTFLPTARVFSPVAFSRFWPSDKIANAELSSGRPLAPKDEPIHDQSADVSDAKSNAPQAKKEVFFDRLSLAPVVADAITISKIDAKLPIETATTTDVAKLHALLDSGVVLYPGSALFGQIGQTILLGHSAPAGWPKIKHDTAFSRISELRSGDEILISYSGQLYRYLVVRTQIINKGVDLPGAIKQGKTLLLVTCWPPGRNLRRIVVEAVGAE